jgi:hypothetical protein
MEKYGQKLTIFPGESMVHPCLPSGNFKSLLLKITIDIVDLPTKNGDFPSLCELSESHC